MLFTPLPQVDSQRVERTECSILASHETVTRGQRLGSRRRRTLWPLQVGRGDLVQAAGLRWDQVLAMPHGSSKKGPSIFGKLNLGTDSPESWNREKVNKKYWQESFERSLSKSRESGKQDAE